MREGRGYNPQPVWACGGSLVRKYWEITACTSERRWRFRPKWQLTWHKGCIMSKRDALDVLRTSLGSTNQAQYFGMSLGNTLKEIRLLTMPHLWKMTFMALIWDITAWYAKKVADFWHANGYCDNGGTCNLYKLIELRAVNKCHCQKRGFYFHLRTLWNQLINEISRLHGSVFLTSLRYLGNVLFSQNKEQGNINNISKGFLFVISSFLLPSSTWTHHSPSFPTVLSFPREDGYRIRKWEWVRPVRKPSAGLRGVLYVRRKSTVAFAEY